MYLNDIIVVGNTADEMVERLQQVFQRIGDEGLKLHPGKWQVVPEESAVSWACCVGKGGCD